ncbi:MAG: VWA domain-containing protein [Polyangiaceae bacterium]
MSGDDPDRAHLRRWRLVLGAASGDALDGASKFGGEDRARDAALAWLYERDESLLERDERRTASDDRSQLTVPSWVNAVHKLFPKETIERLERDAVEEYGLVEVVTNPKVLSALEPSETLLRAVLLTKHLMNQDVLALARELVRKVVRQLVDALAIEVRRAFSGPRAPHRASRGTTRDFDARATIRRNLKHFDAASEKLLIERAVFWSRQRKHSERWQVILLVDQSGSMVSSVIHAAVTAACLWGLPAMKTHLVAFDTDIVDLTSHVTDPVEALMKVQLGGGTDIGRAVRYAESLVENPRRTVIACVTDLYEGGSSDDLVRTVKRLTDQGVRFLALAALDERAEPNFDRDLGLRLARVGAHVGAMTPAELVTYLKQVLR